MVSFHELQIRDGELITKLYEVVAIQSKARDLLNLMAGIVSGFESKLAANDAEVLLATKKHDDLRWTWQLQEPTQGVMELAESGYDEIEGILNEAKSDYEECIQGLEALRCQYVEGILNEFGA